MEDFQRIQNYFQWWKIYSAKVYTTNLSHQLPLSNKTVYIYLICIDDNSKTSLTGNIQGKLSSKESTRLYQIYCNDVMDNWNSNYTNIWAKIK
jgi:hypothetical protein